MKWSRHKRLPRAEIEAHYKKGRSCHQIAEIYGCSPSAIWKILRKELGLDTSPSRIYKLTVRIPKDELSMAYFAGLLDGEGTITLTTSKQAVGGKRPLVSIGNNSEELIGWIKRAFGGRKYSSIKGRPRRLHSWAISGTLDVLKLLSEILPYLIVKKSEAKKVLSFCLWRVKQKAHSDLMLNQIGREA